MPTRLPPPDNAYWIAEGGAFWKDPFGRDPATERSAGAGSVRVPEAIAVPPAPGRAAEPETAATSALPPPDDAVWIVDGNDSVLPLDLVLRILARAP